MKSKCVDIFQLVCIIFPTMCTYTIIFKQKDSKKCELMILNALAREAENWGKKVALCFNVKEIHEIMNFT